MQALFAFFSFLLLACGCENAPASTKAPRLSVPVIIKQDTILPAIPASPKPYSKLEYEKKEMMKAASATIDELGQAITACQSDAETAVVILTGAGEKAFVAGADISAFSTLSAEQGSALSQQGHTVFNMFENSAKPVIAAINGFALGGGCELAMACHILSGK